MTMTTPAGTTYSLFRSMLEQPHLLIAGATGSGKSVALNGLIHDVLFRFPSDIEGGAGLILIDLKRVELGQYRDIPHTLYCATEPKDAVPALQHALKLIDDRYRVMERRGQRLYDGADIYVVIDELADLMTTQRRAVVPFIQRIAQIGRAARVHIIACTQCPIRAVIPTEIGVNFDARLGLHTRNAQDSRNIIGIVPGFPGLHTLPAHGQGLYHSPSGDMLYNIPFVPEIEQQRVIAHWQAQIPANARKARHSAISALLRLFRQGKGSATF